MTFTWTPKSQGCVAETHPWFLEVVKTGPVWFWEVALDGEAGPYLASRTVIAQGDATSLEEGQQQCLQVVHDQEIEWDRKRRRHDHSWVWNGSNFQCQCGATSANNVEVK